MLPDDPQKVLPVTFPSVMDGIAGFSCTIACIRYYLFKKSFFNLLDNY
jgi:hypothetical protein